MEKSLVVLFKALLSLIGFAGTASFFKCMGWVMTTLFPALSASVFVVIGSAVSGFISFVVWIYVFVLLLVQE